MRRNARSHTRTDDQPLLFSDSPGGDDFLQMERLAASGTSQNSPARHRMENTIEAKVEPGDTLQAIALRFHCTVADIKRLNKIDKDNEIHARKIVKIPLTAHSVLLDTLPSVHKSGSNSPREKQKSELNDSRGSQSGLMSIVRNPLEDAEAILSEKLLVASVNSSGSDNTSSSRTTTDSDANDVVMFAKMRGQHTRYSDEDHSSSDMSAPLINDILDDSTNVPRLHRIRGPSMRTLDWSGSDCDMSWVCLFVVILALCFVIPLIYVLYIAEHAHHNTTGGTTTGHVPAFLHH